MGKVRVGMCQLRVVYGDAKDNLARAAGLVRDAASQGADICVIPECGDLGWANPHALELASPIPGPVSDAYCAMARENGVYVVAGITERDGERAYNAAVLVSPEGEILFKHRKINVLTGVEDVYSVGDRLGVTETKLGKIGIDICADNWKQSLPIGHALARMGAQIILSPSSWAVLPDRDLAKNPFGSTWTIPYEELSSIYGIPVVGVSNVGLVTEGSWEGRKAIGASIAFDSNGEMLCMLPYGEDQECVRVVEVEVREPERSGTELAVYAYEQLKARGGGA